MGLKAKAAERILATVPTAQKNKALLAAADAMEQGAEELLAANKLDMDALSPETSAAMRDRLLLTPERVEAMAKGIDEIANGIPDDVLMKAKYTEPVSAADLALAQMKANNKAGQQTMKNIADDLAESGAASVGSTPNAGTSEEDDKKAESETVSPVPSALRRLSFLLQISVKAASRSSDAST